MATNDTNTVLVNDEMYSVTSYQGDGATTEFVVPFPYLYRENVHIYYVDMDTSVRTEIPLYPNISTSTPPSPFEVYWTNNTTLKFVTAPTADKTLEIRRITNRLEPEVVFTDSAILNEDDLNLVTTQLLYVVQEAYDNQSILQADYEAYIRNTLQETITAVSNALEASETALNYANQSTENVTKTAELLAQAQAIFDSIEAETETQISRVVTTTDEQLDRLAGYADVAALAEGFACALQVWTLTEDIPAGSTIVLPNELQYIPNHNHLWLSYGGMVLSKTWFTEVGDSNATSNEFIINTDLKAGQELMAWVIPLGKAYEVELTDRIVALEEALANLSRRVVYADATDDPETEMTE